MTTIINNKWPVETTSFDKPKISKEEYYHNWLYSVVPVSERIADEGINPTNGNYMPITNYPLGAYLTGYCRNCGKAFSQPIPCNAGGYVETQMNVAKLGCVPPERV